MTVDERQTRIRRSLEAKLGVEEATYLMDRPPGGWSELATNQTLAFRFDALDHRFEALDHRFGALDHRFGALDHRFEALEHRLRADFREQTTRLILWIVPTIFAGVAALGAVVAAAA